MGLAILFLNKIRHEIQGYKTPKPFHSTEFLRAIEYDIYVVTKWLEVLNEYVNDKNYVKDKQILELGPGEDLGIGLYLLYQGIKKYNALDVFNLIKQTPVNFYSELFTYLKNNFKANDKSIAYLEEQYELFFENELGNLNYICDKSFDISRFKNIDIVFSQAAFEHFDNIETMISQLSAVVKPGGVLVAQVDLTTHTRWIKSFDPLNIYRFSDFIYNIFKFKGSPNRVRPYQYKEVLEKHGWEKIKVIPGNRLTKEYLSKVTKSLNKKFQTPNSQMDLLSVYLCATKK